MNDYYRIQVLPTGQYCPRFQTCRDDRDLQLSRKGATHHEPRLFPITNQLTQITKSENESRFPD
jgi:hypothetical protein